MTQRSIAPVFSNSGLWQYSSCLKTVKKSQEYFLMFVNETRSFAGTLRNSLLVPKLSRFLTFSLDRKMDAWSDKSG